MQMFPLQYLLFILICIRRKLQEAEKTQASSRPVWLSGPHREDLSQKEDGKRVEKKGKMVWGGEEMEKGGEMKEKESEKPDH